MKFGKKLIASALCLIMIAGMAACTGGGGEASTDQGGTTPDPSTDKVKISYMNWGNDTEQEQTQKTLDAFNESQDKIEASQIAVLYDEYSTKLSALATSKNLPDTAIMLEAVVLKWAQEGMLLDISKMYEGQVAPLDSLAFTYEGKPVAYSSANEVLLLYYNKKLFDDAGVSYPPAKASEAWTWDEFVKNAKLLTKDQSGNTPNDAGFDAENIKTYGCWVDTTCWMWPVFALSNGGGLVSEDGKELLVGKQESIDAAQAIADLYLKDKVAPAPAAVKSMPTLDQTLLSGQVAMATGGQWNVGTTLCNALDDGLDYGVGVLPKFKNAVTYNTGGPNVIFNTTENPDAAMEFLKFFCKEENNMGLIEGGTWMPVLKSWYEDEELIKKWTDNKNHAVMGDAYKTAVIDYAMTNAKQVPWYFLPCYSRLEEVLSPGMDPVWVGDKTAKEAIEGMVDDLQAILTDGKAA